jgi:Spy/CpxP family protein refolding chaperone
MNRYKVLLVLLLVFFMGATAQAQAPPQRGGGAADPAVRDLAQRLEQVVIQMQQFGQQPAGQRGGGGRGAPGTNTNNPDLVGEIQLILAPVDRPVNTTVSNGRGLLVNPVSGAWWTNTALLTRLGLTDDQKLKIERVFESNRQNLTTSKDNLEKEEAQLARLLDAEPLDRGSVTTQIYKVVQARGEMEKVNALMTLEMREVLTRAQWTQLQVQQSVNVSVGAGVAGGGLGAGQRGGGGRGGGIGAGTGGAPGAGTAPAGTGGRGTRGQ